MKKFAVVVLSLMVLLPGLVLGQGGALGINPTDGLYFDQKLDTQLPLDLRFKDENGKDVKLGEYFHSRPVILALVFYQCQSSCLLIRDGLIKSLNSLKTLEAGRDFDVLVVSINHNETPAMALTKKESYLSDYRHPNSEKGWHFLTGSRDSILSLTRAVGFGFTIKDVTDPETKAVTQQISHPSGIVVLTPEGFTSLYLLGATYPQEMLKRGIADARTEKIGPKTETIMLGCFMYDPKTGKYRVVVERALMVGGIGTVLVLFGSIFVMSVRHRREPLGKTSTKGGSAAAP